MRPEYLAKLQNLRSSKTQAFLSASRPPASVAFACLVGDNLHHPVLPPNLPRNRPGLSVFRGISRSFLVLCRDAAQLHYVQPDRCRTPFHVAGADAAPFE